MILHSIENKRKKEKCLLFRNIDIEGSKKIKTRDLSIKSKIGGAKLKDILEFLIKEGLIEETTIKSEKVGRPGVYYSIIE